MSKKKGTGILSMHWWSKDLRTLRTFLGLTQSQLAKKAHLSRPAVSDIERGKWKTLRADTIWHLAQAFLPFVTAIRRAVARGKLTLRQETIDELEFWWSSLETFRNTFPFDYQGMVLRASRERKGLTLRALEKLSGVSKSVIHDLEAGRPVRNRRQKLKKLATVLQIPEEDLFG